MTFSRKPPRYPTLRERRLARRLATERRVNYGLYLQHQFLMGAIRRIGKHLATPERKS